VTMLKQWDLSPIDPQGFDPTEPPGRPLPPTPPTNIAPPQVQLLGTLEVGQQLVCTTGTWTDNPTTYTRQWMRNATQIAGATAAGYSLVTADVGALIGCVVTARTAAGGTADASSNQVGPVTVARPVNNTPPNVTGNPVVGSTLNRTNGTWTGAPTYATQWVGDGVTIPGATGATYILTAGQLGQNVGVVVTATNAGGSTQAPSNTVGPITTTAEEPEAHAAPPKNGKNGRHR
jgi:hypothetical protein